MTRRRGNRVFTDGHLVLEEHWPVGPSSPILRTDHLDVWAYRPHLIDRGGLNTRREFVRASRFRSGRDQIRYLGTKAGIRTVLARYLPVGPEGIRWTRTSNGKPRLEGHPDIVFNATSSGDLALVAIARCGSVGVDVQEPHPWLDDPSLHRRVCSPEELAWLAAGSRDAVADRFVRLWVQKEALLKADGRGLRVPPQQVITVPGVPPGLPTEDPGGWTIREVDVGHGYVAAVASSGPLRRVRTWRLASM